MIYNMNLKKKNIIRNRISLSTLFLGDLVQDLNVFTPYKHPCRVVWLQHKSVSDQQHVDNETSNSAQILLPIQSSIRLFSYSKIRLL